VLLYGYSEPSTLAIPNAQAIPDYMYFSDCAINGTTVPEYLIRTVNMNTDTSKLIRINYADSSNMLGYIAYVGSYGDLTSMRQVNQTNGTTNIYLKTGQEAYLYFRCYETKTQMVNQPYYVTYSMKTYVEPQLLAP